MGYAPGPGYSELAKKFVLGLEAPKVMEGPRRRFNDVRGPVVCPNLYCPGPGILDALMDGPILCAEVPKEKAGGRLFFQLKLSYSPGPGVFTISWSLEEFIPGFSDRLMELVVPFRLSIVLLSSLFGTGASPGSLEEVPKPKEGAVL